MYVKRKSINVANQIIEKSYDLSTDIFDLLSESQKALDDVSQWLFTKKPEDFKTISDRLFDYEKRGEGVPSKFRILQKHTNGYHNGDLIILAARPGMGKTAIILNEAKAQADQEIPVGIFSLEMGSTSLAGRMMVDRDWETRIIRSPLW